VTWHLSRALVQAPPGPIRLVSLCAGQGHDVPRVLPGHPRGEDVVAVLVEASAENAGIARLEAASGGLPGVEVRQADTGLIENLAHSTPTT
jgi:hypothetical protein